MITISIAFEPHDCHALILQQNKKVLTCLNALQFHSGLDQRDTLSEILLPLRKHYRNDFRVIAGMPLTDVIMHDFTIDATLTDIEIMQFLSSQSLAVFGHTASQLRLDYVNTIENNSQTSTIITVVAAHQSTVNFYQSLFAEIKIPLTALDLNFFAQKRFEADASNTTVLQNIGNHFSVALGLCLWIKA